MTRSANSLLDDVFFIFQQLFNNSPIFAFVQEELQHFSSFNEL